MDEARRVLDRLGRIEALREARSDPRILLGELRALLADGEAWLAAERRAGDGGAPADGAGLSGREGEARPGDDRRPGEGAAVDAAGGADGRRREPGRAPGPAAEVGPPSPGDGRDGRDGSVEGAAEALADLAAALSRRAAGAGREEVMGQEAPL